MASDLCESFVDEFENLTYKEEKKEEQSGCG
jgi:hypothetical protein